MNHPLYSLFFSPFVSLVCPISFPATTISSPFYDPQIPHIEEEDYIDMAQGRAFKPGNMAYISNLLLHTDGAEPKDKSVDNDIWYGPYEIIEAVGDSSYRLEFPESINISPTIPAQFLKPIGSSKSHNSKKHKKLYPPAVIVNGQEEYEVEAIINHKYVNGQGTLYQTRWKGYLEADDTWEPESAFTHAKLLLDRYKRSSKGKATISLSLDVSDGGNRNT